jgi:hypothetical protein
MPMTAAHPLAVLPLLGRWRLDTTCLVVGAMSPDFEYFLRVEEVSSVSHTLLGLLYFCVPITIASAYLFHRVLKGPALRVAPWRTRFAVFAERPWPTQPLSILALSALIGAATHYLWDGITHTDGYGPQHLAVLRTPIHGIALCRILQHGSTVIGLAILALVVGRALARVTPVPVRPPTLRVWMIWIGAIAVLTAVSIARVVWLQLHDPGSYVVGIIDGGLGGAIVASLVTR